MGSVIQRMYPASGVDAAKLQGEGVSVKDPSSGQGLVFDNYTKQWIPAPIEAGGVIVSETAPANPEEGDQWFCSSTAQTYTWYSDAWVEVGGGGIAGLGSSDTVEFGPLTVASLTLSDTAWDDIRISSGGFELSGTSDPTQVDWRPGGSGATFIMWEWAKNDQVFATAQLPHSYKAGTNLWAHVHWTPRNYGVAQRGKTVGWKIDITAAGYGSVFAPSVTLNLSQAVPADCANDQHIISPSVEFTVPAGFNESGMLVIRLYRSDTGTDDTWTETLSGRLPLLLELDLHHQINKLGSNEEIPD